MRKSVPVVVGEVFGRLAVIGPVFPKGRALYAPVKCVCGNLRSVEQTTLRRGLSRSCGCLNAELVGARSLTHGKRGDPIYAIWNTMIQRCHSKHNKQYRDYGARGIKVCDFWHVFENFYADMGDPPFKGATLDRKENDKGYSRSNCHWVTRAANNLNRRNTLKYSYLGEERTLRDIAVLCGVRYGTLYQRLITYNWPFEKATGQKETT